MDTPEQEARNILERAGVVEEQSVTAGDLVELANLIARLRRVERMASEYRAAIEAVIKFFDDGGIVQ